MLAAHFANEEMKVQRGRVSCLRSHDQKGESKATNSFLISLPGAQPVTEQPPLFPRGFGGEQSHTVSCSCMLWSGLTAIQKAFLMPNLQGKSMVDWELGRKAKYVRSRMSP